MTEFFELKKEIKEQMEAGLALAGQLGYESVSESIQENIDAMERRELVIVVAGEARRGKSTLLNVLLNEAEDVFPVDINVCTNVVTVVRYGEEEKIEAYIEDESAPDGVSVRQLTRGDIPEYVSEMGNPDNYKRVRMLNAAVPNEFLRDGIVVVDTPGVGSLNIAHAETTYGFLPNADLLLFVTDADAGMTETELDFLKRSYQYCQNVIFPVTKMDLNPNYEKIVEDNREKICQALELEEVVVVPVSSEAKRIYLETGDESFYENSNFAELERLIWQGIVEKRAQIMLWPFLAEARQEMQHMEGVLSAQHEMLLSGRDKAEQMVALLNEKMKELSGLQNEGADWQNDLTVFRSTLNSEVGAFIQDLKRDVQAELDNQAADCGTQICKPENYLHILQELNGRISRGALELKEDIQGQVLRKRQEIEEGLGLNVDVNGQILEKIRADTDGTFSVHFKQKKKTEIIIGKGRKIAMNGSGGAAIGAILGGAIGLFIGGPAGLVGGAKVGGIVGTLAGGSVGVAESLTQYEQTDVNVVLKAFNQHISAAMANLSRSAMNAITELGVFLSGDFSKRLKRRIKELQSEVNKLQKNMTVEKSDIPEKIAALEEQYLGVQNCLNAMDKLEARILGEELPEQYLIEPKPELPTQDCPEQNTGTGEAQSDGGEESAADITYDFL